MDEPESALDFHFRYQMLKLIQEWKKTNHSTALISLHDPMLALNSCDCLLLLLDGGIHGTLHPQTDTLSNMEEKLCHLYGDISLHQCTNKHDQKHIVMLGESF